MWKKERAVSLAVILINTAYIYPEQKALCLSVPGAVESHQEVSFVPDNHILHDELKASVKKDIETIGCLIDNVLSSVQQNYSARKHGARQTNQVDQRITILKDHLAISHQVLLEKFEHDDSDFWDDFHPLWAYRCICRAEYNLQQAYILISFLPESLPIIDELFQAIQIAKQRLLSYINDQLLKHIITIHQLEAYVVLFMFMEQLSDESLRRELWYMRNAVIKLSDKGTMEPIDDLSTYRKDYFSGCVKDSDWFLQRLQHFDYCFSSHEKEKALLPYPLRLGSAFKALEKDVSSGGFNDYMNVQYVALNDVHAAIELFNQMLDALVQEWWFQFRKNEIDVFGESRWQNIFNNVQTAVKQLIETSLLIRYGIIPNMQKTPAPNPQRDVMLKRIGRQLMPDIDKALACCFDNVSEMITHYYSRQNNKPVHLERDNLSEEELVAINFQQQKLMEEFIAEIDRRVKRVKSLFGKNKDPHKGPQKYAIRRFHGNRADYTVSIEQIVSAPRGAGYYVDAADRQVYQALSAGSVLRYVFQDEKSYEALIDAANTVKQAGKPDQSDGERMDKLSEAVEQLCGLIGAKPGDRSSIHNTIHAYFDGIPKNKRPVIFNEEPLRNALTLLQRELSRMRITRACSGFSKGAVQTAGKSMLALPSMSLAQEVLQEVLGSGLKY
ncbi:MAG: hypothetical protein ABII23_06905 [bacterium]